MIWQRTIWRDDADYPRRQKFHEAHGVFDALRCCGPSQSKSSQNSSQTTVSTAGDTSPAGNSAPVNQGTTQLVAGGNVTADPLITDQAFQTIQSLVGQALDNSQKTQQFVTDANGQNNNALNSVLSSVLSRDQGIASNVATGGASGQQTFILWFVGIVAAAIFVLPSLIRKIPGRKKAA